MPLYTNICLYVHICIFVFVVIHIPLALMLLYCSTFFIVERTQCVQNYGKHNAMSDPYLCNVMR